MTDRTTAPGTLRRDARPPISSDSAPSPGAVGSVARPTAIRRPSVSPLVWGDGQCRGVPASHPYVRRFWTPVLGPGAVADLLRLATAAARGRSLLRPTHLAVLIKHGLVRVESGSIMVRIVVPYLDAATEGMLHPAFRRAHRETMRELRAKGRIGA